MRSLQIGTHPDFDHSITVVCCHHLTVYILRIMAWNDDHRHLSCCPSSSISICFSHLSILTSEIKVDQSHVKGAKTKVKNKAKKDKKKNQNTELAEQKDAKPKVDELVVSTFSYHLQ